MAITLLSRARRRAALPAAVLGLVLVATACGGSGSKLAAASPASGATGSGATGSGASGNEAFAAYQQCLADHGVTGGFGGGRRNGAGATGATGANASGATGRRGGNGGGTPGTNADGTPRTTVDPTVLQAAQDACESLRPQGAGGFGGGASQNAQEFGAYLSCLSDNGVTIPGRGSGATGAPPATGAGAPPANASGATGAPGAPGGPGGPGGGRGFGLGQIDRTSPTFVAANEKCKVLLPDGVDPFAGRPGGSGPAGGAPAGAPTTTVAK